MLTTVTVFTFTAVADPLNFNTPHTFFQHKSNAVDITDKLPTIQSNILENYIALATCHSWVPEKVGSNNNDIPIKNNVKGRGWCN
jgi:hypothetical protein